MQYQIDSLKELITAPSSGSTLWNTSVLNETTCDAYEWHGENSNIAKALAVATGWGEYDDDCTVGYDQSTNNSTCFSAVPAGYFYGSDNIWDDSGFYCCVYSANFLSTTQSMNSTPILAAYSTLTESRTGAAARVSDSLFAAFAINISNDILTASLKICKKPHPYKKNQ